MDCAEVLSFTSSNRCLSIYSDKKSGIPHKAESRFLAFHGFLDDFAGLCFGRELEHDLPAANGDAFLFQSIERLLALFADIHKVRVAQNGEVMRDRRLREANLFHDLVDRLPTTTTLAHDLLASFIGDRFGKKDRISFHRRLSI